MKNTLKKALPLILSIAIILSSIGFTASSAFDEKSFNIKSPFSISSAFFSQAKDVKGNKAENVQPVAQQLKQAAAPGSNASGIAGVFKAIGDFFKTLFNTIKSWFTPKTPSTTKAPTTKKTTTTTKKTTTTTKKTTTTTKKTTTTTKKTTTTTKKTTTTTKKATTTKRSEALIYDSAFLNEALTAINNARRAAGVSSLRIDTNMAKAASVRAKEISTSFGHTRPDGRKSYTVYADCGMTKPSAVAENISSATRFDNATDIINLWLSSADHKANVISSKYTRVGVAWYINGNGKEYAVMLLANG